MNMRSVPLKDLSWMAGLGHAAGAVGAFHVGYSFSHFSFLIVIYLYCLLNLARLPTSRRAFYFGLAIGLMTVGPQLNCFYNIFGWAAVALWLILAFWIAVFVLLARLCRTNFSSVPAAVLVPFVWTGLEYFRSELYYLRFSWLNVGYVFSDTAQWLPLKQLGVYGIGLLLVAIVSALSLLSANKQMGAGLGLVAALAAITNAPQPASPQPADSPADLQVAGVQLEFPPEAEVLLMLNKAVRAHPQAQLLVLSEYTFDGPVPEKVKMWCRDHQRYLATGGKDWISDSEFFDSVFVVDPHGDVVFKQAKSVPIQFFKDGLPARNQSLWESPWGRIGFCICYDLSYTRVTDRLVRLGAQALVVPTMDVVEWGKTEHLLHGRVAPVRAAEYGIPIFRVASSGVSQLIDARGQVAASAPFPGQSAMVAGSLSLKAPGRLPWDRGVAVLSVFLTAGLIGQLAWRALRHRFVAEA